MPGRNWLEALLLVLAMGFAVEAWTSGSAEQTITATYPVWAQGIWYGGLILGSLIALTGLLWHTLNGWLLQRAGLLVLGSISASYGSAFLIHAGRADLLHSMFVVIGVGIFGAACLARARQIRREIEAGRTRRLAVLHALAPPPEAIP